MFPTSTGLEEEDWKDYIRRHRAAKRDFLSRLPGHYDLVNSIRSQSTQPSWAPNVAGTVPLPGTVGMPARPAPAAPAEPVMGEGALL